MKQVLWIAMVPLLVAGVLVLLALTCGCGALVDVNVQNIIDQYKDSDAALVGGPEVMNVSHDLAPGK